MTIDALAHKTRRGSAGEAEPLAIGEADANILDCPGCRRPLDAGATRCPGCGTRLLAGIRLSKALTFLGTGVLLGAVVGGGSVGLVARTTTPTAPTTPGVVPAASAAPVAPAASAPGPAPASAAPAAGVPAASVSALRQATLLNQRLVADADRLAAALAAPEPSSAELARILRSLAGNAAVGERIAPVIGEWDRGTVVAIGFADLYAAIGGTARDGLGAALGNTTAYVDAATAMRTLLATLPALDAQARSFAGTAQVELPPLTGDPAAP